MDNFTTPILPTWLAAMDEQPRERFLRNGLSALSNSEVLSLLITSGGKDTHALNLAREVLNRVENNLNELGKISINDLRKVKGIGVAKAIAIAAALELGRRRQIATPLSRVCITQSSDIANYLQVLLKDYDYEVFAVIFLNRGNRIKHFEIISKGGITGTVADPRIIMKKALDHSATAIVLSHNHPSGSLRPSRADQELTIKIKEAARYFDISVLDHIIVSDEGYYSFVDEGIL